MSGQPFSDVEAIERAFVELARHADGIERRAYVAGWRWGLVCRLAAGICATGLGVWLVQLVLAALPQ